MSGLLDSHCHSWGMEVHAEASPGSPLLPMEVPGPLGRTEMMVCCDGGSGQPARSNTPVSGRQACCLHLARPQGLAQCPRGLA